MLIDSVLLLGCVLIAFGVLRILGLMVSNTSPMRGIIITIIGSLMVFWVYKTTGGELTTQDIPEALFRIMGTFL